MTASERLGDLIARKTWGGCLPEADRQINAASRAVIREVKARGGGVCWLGVFRPENGKPALFVYRGGPVRNFAADFAVPVYDPELERLLGLWRARFAPETIEAILTRVALLGGEILVWT